MKTIALPRPEQAQRVLAEVGFEDRLTGVKMSPMSGNKHFSLYSLSEVVEFLHMDRPEELLRGGAGSSVGYVDLSALGQWIGRVLGDKELAGQVAIEADASDNYLEGLGKIKPLLQNRIAQCVQVLAS